MAFSQGEGKTVYPLVLRISGNVLTLSASHCTTSCLCPGLGCHGCRVGGAGVVVAGTVVGCWGGVVAVVVEVTGVASSGAEGVAGSQSAAGGRSSKI